MGNFNDRGRSGGNKFDSKYLERKEMFSAVCSECGKDCKVPFKPTGNKPVFCSDCFRKHDGDEKKDFGGKQMFTAHCDDCGKKCEVPFKPVPGKEVFCSDCFTKRGETKSPDTDFTKLQSRLDILNSKLDKIMKLLERKLKKEEVETISELIAEE